MTDEISTEVQEEEKEEEGLLVVLVVLWLRIGRLRVEGEGGHEEAGGGGEEGELHFLLETLSVV